MCDGADDAGCITGKPRIDCLWPRGTSFMSVGTTVCAVGTRRRCALRLTVAIASAASLDTIACISVVPIGGPFRTMRRPGMRKPGQMLTARPPPGRPVPLCPAVRTALSGTRDPSGPESGIGWDCRWQRVHWPNTTSRHRCAASMVPLAGNAPGLTSCCSMPSGFALSQNFGLCGPPACHAGGGGQGIAMAKP